MLAWQFNTVGVSDAITMGGEGRLSSTSPGHIQDLTNAEA